MFHCSSYLPHSNGTVAVVPVQVREIHRASIEEQGWGSILPAPPEKEVEGLELDGVRDPPPWGRLEGEVGCDTIVISQAHWRVDLCVELA